MVAESAVYATSCPNTGRQMLFPWRIRRNYAHRCDARAGPANQGLAHVRTIQLCEMIVSRSLRMESAAKHLGTIVRARGEEVHLLDQARYQGQNNSVGEI